MLEVKEVCKSFGDKQVVDNLSFTVQEGEVFALIGSNGAGKTTTIKMILGLLKKNTGEINLKQGITIGYSPETPYFPPFLTGREVLKFYAKLQKLSKDEVQNESTRLLEVVGLKEDETKVSNYSKGMLQRLALAQALLGNPDLLILDEPTAGLDALGRIEMLKIIGDLRKAGKTIIINSHILSDVERICNRGIILNQGKIIYQWEKEHQIIGKTLEDIFTSVIGGNQL